ncbi:GNAT family N-acetyltransferase [Reinekea thalattae]|nr:GNAT family N-acetyltransferase [Reinekea thalattae]
MMNIEVVQANYTDEKHAKHIPYLLSQYACDPMGGGKALSEHTINHLSAELAKLPHAFSVIVYVDGEPAALANCFQAFSTFACKPLVNIHDVCVLKQYRGLGLSRKLFDKIEVIARDLGCCKITLEVLSNNEVAKSAYTNFGFSCYELDPTAGGAMFWQKSLS